MVASKAPLRALMQDSLTTPTRRWSRARFDRAVAPHVGDLHARARWMVGSDDLAWDVVQETLLRAWSWGELPEDPRGVLLDLVRLSALHHLRCDARRRVHEEGAASERTHCCCEDPLRAVVDEETRAGVARAIASLAVEYRSVIELVGVEGASYQHAAERLGIPIGTVRSRVSRARERLRAAVGDELVVA